MIKKLFFSTLLFLSVTYTGCGQDKKPSPGIATFIPDGFQILDTACGDINRDRYADCVVALKHKDEASNGDLARPLLVLAGTANGGFRLLARNDSVVMCGACGGVMGDPYQDIVVKRGYFSVEHYGGSSWRWTRIITFRFDRKRKLILLHKDAGVSFHASDPGKEEHLIHNKQDFGQLPFDDYSNTKGQE